MAAWISAAGRLLGAGTGVVVPVGGGADKRENPRGLFGEPDHAVAGFFLEFEESAFLAFAEEVGEGAEAVGALVEPGVLAFDGLLHHGGPDAFVGATFVDEGVDGG